MPPRAHADQERDRRLAAHIADQAFLDLRTEPDAVGAGREHAVEPACYARAVEQEVDRDHEYQQQLDHALDHLARDLLADVDRALGVLVTPCFWMFSTRRLPMSLTCTRLSPRASSQSWKRSTRRSAEDSCWPGCFSNSLRDRVGGGGHLVDGGDAREPDRAEDAGRERDVDDEHRQAARHAQETSAATSGLSSIAMMPEIRKMKRACRTALGEDPSEEQDRRAARPAGSSAG